MTTQPMLYDFDGVERISSSLAAETVVRHHYLHRRPPISHAFGLWQKGKLMGVVTYGVPASRHVQVSVCRSNPDLSLELNRLWVSDDMPKNTESNFVAQSLRALPPLIVFSYADTAAGHVGYIYRALNFNYAGITDADRKTPRFDRVPISVGKHPRESSRSGFTGEVVQRSSKHRYWKCTGNRAERKRLEQLCSWPLLSWLTQ